MQHHHNFIPRISIKFAKSGKSKKHIAYVMESLESVLKSGAVKQFTPEEIAKYIDEHGE